MEGPMIAQVLASSPNPALKEICNAKLPLTKRDDATNTSTVGETSCDGEEIKVSIRLGGILPSDDEDFTINQSSDDGPTAPQASPASTSTDSLHSQIATLQEIASMESKEYQQLLMKNSAQSKLHDSRLVQLSQSLHRFHSVILNLNEENDCQTREILHLQAQYLESQNQIAKLEAVVSKLVEKNQKLRNKYRSGRGVHRKLVERMETIANVHRQEEEAIDKLLQHEQVLRDRCDSNFSNFSSDFDTKSVDTFASNRSLVTNEPPTVRLHKQRNLTWTPSDLEEEISASDDAKSVADCPKSPEGESARPRTTATTTDHTSDDDRNLSNKICEGGSSVTTADIWKASMRQQSSSTTSGNFWNTNSTMMSNDAHRKVNRSNILDLDEASESPTTKYTSCDISIDKNDDKHRRSSEKQESDHPFLSIFQKVPQKKKSFDKKKDFDFFDVLVFKKNDASGKLEGKQDDIGTLSKNSASNNYPSYGNNCPSGTKNESKRKEERQEDVADKFRSSMKNMGKIFTFH